MAACAWMRADLEPTVTVRALEKAKKVIASTPTPAEALPYRVADSIRCPQSNSTREWAPRSPSAYKARPWPRSSTSSSATSSRCPRCPPATPSSPTRPTRSAVPSSSRCCPCRTRPASPCSWSVSRPSAAATHVARLLTSDLVPTRVRQAARREAWRCPLLEVERKRELLGHM